MIDVKALGTAFVAGVKTHKPEIMIGFGLAAGVGAVVMAVKETPACLEAFEKAEAEVAEKTTMVKVEEDKYVEVPEQLDWKQKVLIFGKYYWSVIALEGASIFLIVYGSKIRFNGYTALMTVYGLTKAELDDLKQVISEQPDNWKKKFREKVAESHVDKSDAKDVPAECMTNAEVPMPKPLFWDDQARVYFRLSEEELRDALAEFTNKIMTDPFQTTSMNDWMEIIGHEDIANGDYYLMTLQDPDWDGALKYNQIGVKPSPTGEPARMMTFSKDYHLDTRGMYATI